MAERYILHECLGAGGMGVVYRATDRLTNQEVALKQVTRANWGPAPRNEEQLRLTLAQEFRVLAGLRHPHIISVLDYGFDAEGRPFFTMDLLEDARTIHEYGWRRDQRTRTGLLIQMLQALSYLHRRGILHRDLKPENVLVYRDMVKVLDFGLALHGEPAPEDDLVGTLLYMAPEVLAGDMYTASADLYAAGLIGYELYAGHECYQFDSVADLIDQILNVAPDVNVLDVMPQLAGVIARLTAKNPADRFKSVKDALRRLSQAVDMPEHAATEIRESFLQAARFVGRERELAQLNAALDETMKGSGNSWLIGGESGVGKSRLLEELRTRALVKGALVLQGQAISEVSTPYGLWQDVIRRLVLYVEVDPVEAGIFSSFVPGLEVFLSQPPSEVVEIDPGAVQVRLAGHLLAVLRRAGQPVVIILEDLQWAGTESLGLLNRISERAADMPVLLIGSFRDDEAPQLPEKLPGLRSIRLWRLDAAEIVALSESMLGPTGRQPNVVELLQRETEGNVFFVIEVVRALSEEAGDLDQIGIMTLPERVFAGGVQRIVERRLRRVPERWLPLLNVAAIMGRQPDLQVLAVLAPEVDLSAWMTDCVNAAVFELVDANPRFAHDKLRDSLLAAMDENQRRQLHRQIAETLEAIYPGDRHYAAVLAHHWDGAGDVQQSMYYLGIAGHQALLASAYTEAIRLFERVLGLLPDKHAPNIVGQRALVCQRMANAYWGLSQYDRADRLYADSLRWFREVDDKMGMADALKGLGDVARRRGDYAAARANFLESLALCRQYGDPTNLGQALARVGLVARNQGNMAEARDYYQQSLTVYRDAGLFHYTGSLLSGLGLVAADQGDFALARQYMLESLEVTRGLHNPTGTALVLTGLAWIEYLDGVYNHAQTHSLESLRLSEAVGDRWMVGNNLGNLGKIMLELGDDDLALDYLRQGLAVSMTIGALPLTLEILPGVAKLWLRQGRMAKALALLHLARTHPATYYEVTQQAEPLLAEIRQALTPEQYEAVTAQPLELESVVDEIIYGGP